MICLKCRAEIEDLSMYCPNCGAPQFTPKHDEEIVLELNDPMKSKVVIMEITNMTSALSTLKNITGLSIAEIRNALKELPATELCTAGIKAEAVSGSVSINDHGETDEKR